MSDKVLAEMLVLLYKQHERYPSAPGASAIMMERLAWRARIGLINHQLAPSGVTNEALIRAPQPT